MELAHPPPYLQFPLMYLPAMKGILSIFTQELKVSIQIVIRLRGQPKEIHFGKK